MTKAELIAAMARATGSPKASAERAVNALVATIRDSLRKGRRVTIAGFGTFGVTRRAARNGKNPRTGKTMTIPAARVPRFKPSRALKAALR
ncbi:MAG: HU family DNA-binding protein [Candidatus Rokubacteria bacterium]|nr:HU family DNA-binding protein [Candidatus Rokubacteria bacterium]